MSGISAQRAYLEAHFRQHPIQQPHHEQPQVIETQPRRPRCHRIVHNVHLLASTIFRYIGRLFKVLWTRIVEREQRGLARYRFTQQFNDSCHVSPVVNRELIQKFREADYNVEALPARTRRQWMGENQTMLRAWHEPISEITTAEGQERYPELYQFLVAGATDGPTLPHYYKENGDFAFKGLTGLLDFMGTPYFLMNVDQLAHVEFKILGLKRIRVEDMMNQEQLGLKAAIVKNRGEEGYEIYNKVSGDYEPLSQLDCLVLTEEEGRTVIEIDPAKVTEELRQQYDLPSEGQKIIMVPNNGLGFQEIGVYAEMGKGLDIDGQTHIPFQMSLLKLMFLLFGYDTNNEPIQPGTDLHRAHLQLKELMSRDPNNPWHPDKFQPEMLMQFHLANLFKNDPALLEAAKQTLKSTIGGYDLYERLMAGEYYDQDGNKLERDRIAPYLLGDEQAVAYYFMRALRYTWYTAVSPKAGERALELGMPLPKYAVEAMLTYKARRLIRLEGDFSNDSRFGDGVSSFVEVWRHMQSALRQQCPGQQEFISFDDHGWVLSLDDQLIQRQDQSPTIYDRSFLRELNFAGIESWMSSELNLWYKTN